MLTTTPKDRNRDEFQSLLGGDVGRMLLEVRLQDASQLVSITGPKAVVGSAPHCDIRLASNLAQPVEVIILRGASSTTVRRWSAEALLNGNPFEDATLCQGDILSCGQLTLEVIADSHSDDLDDAAATGDEPHRMAPMTAETESIDELSFGPDGKAPADLNTHGDQATVEDAAPSDRHDDDLFAELRASLLPGDESPPEVAPLDSLTGNFDPAKVDWNDGEGTKTEASDPSDERTLFDTDDEPKGENDLQAHSISEDPFESLQRRLDEAVREAHEKDRVPYDVENLSTDFVSDSPLDATTESSDQQPLLDTDGEGAVNSETSHLPDDDVTAQVGVDVPADELSLETTHAHADADARPYAENEEGVDPLTAAEDDSTWGDSSGLAFAIHGLQDAGEASEPANDEAADRPDVEAVEPLIDIELYEESDAPWGMPTGEGELTIDEQQADSSTEEPVSAVSDDGVYLSKDGETDLLPDEAAYVAADEEVSTSPDDADDPGGYQEAYDPSDEAFEFETANEDDHYSERNEETDDPYAEHTEASELEYAYADEVAYDAGDMAENATPETEACVLADESHEYADEDSTDWGNSSDTEEATAWSEDNYEEDEQEPQPPIAYFDETEEERAAATHAEPSEDGSIEDYMRKLLERVGTEPNGTGPPEVVTRTKAATKTSDHENADALKKTKTSQWPLAKTKSMPERITDLAAMRELANESARTAISQHTATQHQDIARNKLFSAAALGLGSAILLILSHLRANLLLFAGIMLLGVAIHSVLQGLKSTVVTTGLSGKRKPRRRKKTKSVRSPKMRQQAGKKRQQGEPLA